MAIATQTVDTRWTAPSPWPTLPASWLGNINTDHLPDPTINDLVLSLVDSQRGRSYLAWHRYTIAGQLHTRLVSTTDPHDLLLRDGTAECAARIAYAMAISQTAAEKLLTQAVALRDRLPQVALRLRDGRICEQLVATIIARTELCDGQTYAHLVDAEIADTLDHHHGAWSQTGVRTMVDRIVHRHDPDAIRERRQRALDARNIWTSPDRDGVARLTISGAAENVRLADTAIRTLATHVCDHDPRTLTQRRSDAAFARLMNLPFTCACDHNDCTLATHPDDIPTEGSIVIHVVCDEATLNGHAEHPAWMDGHGIISGAHVRDLAARPDSVITPLTPPATPVQPDGTILVPATQPANPYRPSTALDTLVRIRDGHSVIPGNTTSAWTADLDHVTEYNHHNPATGGQTIADNLNAKDRLNHLLKTHGNWLDDQWRNADGNLRQEFVTPEGLAIPGEPENFEILFPGLHRYRFTPAPQPPPPHNTSTTPEPTRTQPRVAAKHARRHQERERNRARREAAEQN